MLDRPFYPVHPQFLILLSGNDSTYFSNSKMVISIKTGFKHVLVSWIRSFPRFISIVRIFDFLK